MHTFALRSIKWMRWVLIPAFVSTILLAITHPVYAQTPDPNVVEELTRGLNTLWVLITAFLVFWMQAGFALVEAGLTRSKIQPIFCSRT